MKSENNVVLLKDSVLIPLVYSLKDLRSMYNNFIEHLDSLSNSMGKNECLEVILAGSRQKRYFIREFIESINGTMRVRRQAVMGMFGLRVDLIRTNYFGNK